MISATGISPGKLILSGEHAVVKGAPAVAMAVDRFVATHIVPAETPPFQRLPFIKTSLELRYHAFLKKSLTIAQVVDKPEALIAYAVAQLEPFFDPDQHHPGFALSTQTNLPVGCGMGSSAALILSIHRALQGAFGFELPPDTLRELAIEAENLVHGKSSGLDIAVCRQGGMLHFERGQITAIPMEAFHVNLIHTGKPESSTGECVVQAGLYLTPAKVEQFSQVTQKMADGLRREDGGLLFHAIRENHRLLCDIGVVPHRVQRLIAEIEAAGGAAKICGAGSVKGDNAGIVWVHGNAVTAYQKIAETHAADWMGDVQLCPQGALSCEA